MKSTINKIHVITLFLFIVSGISNASAHDYPVKILMQAFPPYNYSENNEIKGYATEVVRAIMKELRVNYDILEYPDSRVHEMLDNEKGIMSYVLFRTSERENKYKWIGPIATDHVRAYKKKGSSLVINTIDDAKKVRRIAAYHRGVIYDRLMELGFENIDKSPIIDGLFKKVLSGRVDLMIGLPDLGVKHWLKGNNYASDSLVRTQVRIATFDMYIVCTMDIPDSIVSKWQQSLDGLKSSGEFGRIFGKYR